VEVPNVAGSIDIWQAFRDAWTRSVVFGRQSPSSALHDAAAKTSKILGEY
jgi:multiple sugar transport system substrate-binding protein